MQTIWHGKIGGGEILTHKTRIFMYVQMYTNNSIGNVNDFFSRANERARNWNVYRMWLSFLRFLRFFVGVRFAFDDDDDDDDNHAVDLICVYMQMRRDTHQPSSIDYYFAFQHMRSHFVLFFCALACGKMTKHFASSDIGTGRALSKKQKAHRPNSWLDFNDTSNDTKDTLIAVETSCFSRNMCVYLPE